MMLNEKLSDEDRKFKVPVPKLMEDGSDELCMKDLSSLSDSPAVVPRVIWQICILW